MSAENLSQIWNIRSNSLVLRWGAPKNTRQMSLNVTLYQKFGGQTIQQAKLAAFSVELSTRETGSIENEFVILYF